MGKISHPAGNDWGNVAQAPEKIILFSHGGTILRAQNDTEVEEYFVKNSLWQGDCASQGIQQPSQDFVDCRPACISALEFFDGDRIFASGFARVIVPENRINCMKKESLHG
mmetsp:Transcript_51889/g.155726  ORF Transcript_51889/g.155726 Transcript_51889/m.155726 type:complete len:111 (-) Transcript_51889:1338-1670(-)